MARTIRLGIALLTLGFAIGFVLFYNDTKSELIISDHMSEFVDAVDRHQASPGNKLVALDLDDTIFTSSQLLGTPTWFYHMINLMRQRGAAKQEAYDVMNKIDKFVQERTQVVLIEQATLSAVSVWQKQNIMVVGFSSRLKNMASITETQLNGVGIRFTSPYFSCVASKWPKEDGGFINGVIYVDDYANKVKILEIFYELLISCGMEIDLIAQAEDQQHYINEGAKMAKKRHVDFIGMIYGGAFSNRVFDLKEANKQLLDLEVASNLSVIPEQYRDIFTH